MKINVREVNNSIWLLLPVAIVIAEIVAIFNGGFHYSLLGLALGILTVGTIVWIPSMAFTFFTEAYMLNEKSTETSVLLIFGFETAVTFFIITLLFGGLASGIPFLALGMSVATQLSRWMYLKHKNRLYKKSEIEQNENLLDI